MGFEQILVIVVIAVPTALGAAAWLLREYVKGWIEKKFSAQLEASRHENAKELQQLKSRFDIELNRVEKIINKEFEILPEAWNKLQDAYSAVGSIVIPFREYPDLDRYTPPELESFLEGSVLKEHHRKEITQASSKTEKFKEISFRYELNNAQRKISEYSAFIRKNAIFIRSELKSKFLEIENLLSDVLIDRQYASGVEGAMLWREAFKKLKEQIQPKISELEDFMQSALHKGQGDLPDGGTN